MLSIPGGPVVRRPTSFGPRAHPRTMPHLLYLICCDAFTLRFVVLLHRQPRERCDHRLREVPPQVCAQVSWLRHVSALCCKVACTSTHVVACFARGCCDRHRRSC